MGIEFSDHQFTEPLLLSQWEAPYKAGLYAVLIYDTSCSPKPYRLVYIGQSSNMSERDIGASHHKYTCWTAEAQERNTHLYIVIHLMPNSTEQERLGAKQKIIQSYDPSCNG